MNRPQLESAFADHRRRLAMHNSATDEIVRRRQALESRGHELAPETYAAERDYLAQAGAYSDHTARSLIAERGVLDAERAALEQREQWLQHGKTAATVAGKGAVYTVAGAAAGGMALWESKLLTKVGIVTLGLAAATFLTAGGSPETAATLGAFAVGTGALWVLIAIFGSNHKSGARPTAPAMQATTVQDQALAAAQEREQQAAAEADRIRAEAEQRRAEAIKRAQQQTTTDSDWD